LTKGQQGAEPGQIASEYSGAAAPELKRRAEACLESWLGGLELGSPAVIGNRSLILGIGTERCMSFEILSRQVLIKDPFQIVVTRDGLVVIGAFTEEEEAEDILVRCCWAYTATASSIISGIQAADSRRKH
jgi:hypothetical protein